MITSTLIYQRYILYLQYISFFTCIANISVPSGQHRHHDSYAARVGGRASSIVTSVPVPFSPQLFLIDVTAPSSVHVAGPGLSSHRGSPPLISTNTFSQRASRLQSRKHACSVVAALSFE